MFEKETIAYQILGLFIMFFLMSGILALRIFGIIPKGSLQYLIPLIMLWTVGLIIYKMIKYNRSKTFEPFISDKLYEMGFKYISERPLTLNESLMNLEIQPTILINGIPISNFKYIARNERIIIVEDKNRVRVRLHCEIIKTWTKNYKLIIKSKKKIKTTSANLQQ